ncbi:unnamed protein product [Closterium sp. NIES-53]
MFTRRPESSLYTLATKPPRVAAPALGPVAPPCSCHLLSHQTLLWDHRLGHPSLPRLRGMHSRLLVSGLPRSLPPLPPSPAPPCLPCIEGRQRAAPHSSSFSLTTSPLQTLHMDVWGPARGSHAFVRDSSADKLSALAIPCVFLVFSPDAPGWQFYHPTSRRVFPSQDVTFDEPGPAPSGVSQVDPLPGTVPVEVAVDSGAARGAASGVAASGVVEPGSAEPGGAESEGAGSGGTEPGGAEPGGAEYGGAEPRATGARDSATGDTGAGGAGVTAGADGTRGAAAASPRGARTRGTGAAGTGSVGGTGDGDSTEPGAAGAGGTGAGGAGASQLLLQPASALPAPSPYTEQTGGFTERRVSASRPASPIRTGRRVPRPRPPLVPGTHALALRPSSVPLRVPLPPPPESSLPTVPDPESDLAHARLLATVVTDPSFESSEQTGGFTEPREPESQPALPFRAIRTGHRVPRPRPPPVPGIHAMALRPSSAPLRVPLLAPPVVPDPESDGARAASPTVSRLLAPFVTYPSFESDVASALVAELEDLECLAGAVPRFASMLLAPEGDPDAPDIPTPRSYAEAITGPYSSQWQAAMDAEMASWKSTSTYVHAVPPSRANIVDGMWIFRVKRPPGSPPAFKARYIARGFNQRQGVDYFQSFSPTPKMTTLRVFLHVAAQHDYELHSLDFSTNFLQGSLHEEIWLRRPPGFTGSFPPGTQWSLRRPVYGLRQTPREWHDTLRTTLAALGFNPSTADPSLFLRTDTLLPPFYVLVYVDDLVFATADTEALTLVKSELQKRHTCIDLGELCNYLGLQITQDRARRTITLTQSHMVHQVLQRFGFQFSSPQPTPLSTGHSLSAPPSDESVEPSGPYPELVARYVAPGRHRKVHWDAAKRVLHYLCSTSGMGLVLGGRGPVVLTGHADASWVNDSATQRSSHGYTFSLGFGSVSCRSTCSSSVLSSNCEAEIYAGAMATQELRWLTYLFFGLGEQPRSPPVLYVDNKAMIALCKEHRLEHRMKHIALRYCLARELQKRG